ncbi:MULTISPECIES: SAV_2336 N-terminal domain-related protein [unclassified Streptomyces]|uniref:SAV_2336 N-terminal domain-related protein n=1 Tax=unclassified Streptomyces TaxID=2593676 RepID=UPI0009656CF0|nr:SAV_2336 N-terminal domain-related protein [Streptomyces sp. CB01883]OKJ83409.1 serine/threonine protein kinase [Streptomyces sp. CB01883]
MSSDPAASPDPLARLADVLAEASGGARPTPLELAELLWLAGRMRPGGRDTAGAADATGGGQPVPVRDAPAPAVPPAPDGPSPAAAHPPGPTRPPEPPSRVPLHLPAHRPAPAAGGAPHTQLLAPAPPMLRHPLALQRALRPLARRVDASVGRELDERATAERIARLGAGPEWWLPVLRPARERWLRLNLVYDAGPTMPVWRPLVRELHTALAQSGAFRTVGLYRAAPDGTVRGPGAHAPGDGRTVTLLVSDCMGPQWREGPAGTRWYATLHRWARRMPLAVVQPLPEHLWRDTALPAVPGRLSAPGPAAPTAALAFTPYEPPGPRDPHEPPLLDGAVPLPVLEPEPRWLAHWAALLTTPGAEVPGAVAALRGPLAADAEDRTDVGVLSAEELVLRFRATASPEAFRLAGHLAVGRPDLPVMRLVQAAVEPDPRPQHLAEVVLSGMLTAVPGGPPGSYAFRDGVRELLLLGLPRTAHHSTAQLLARMGGFIDRRAGRAPGEFRASVPAARGAGAGVEGDPFATVRADSVRRLTADRDGQPDPRRGALGFTLLGAFGVTRGGRPLAVEDPHTRALLCMLLLRRGRPASWAELAAGCWDPPVPSGVRMPETYLARLRHLLGPDILTTGGGYALHPERVRELDGRDGVDVFRFRRLAGEAERAGAAGDPERSRELAAEALESWRGDPLPGVPGPAAEETREGLRALHRALSATTARDGAPAERPGILFTADELAGRPEARITLEAAVHEVLSRGSLGSRRHEVEVRPDGYLVRTEPGAYLLPVLVAVLRELPQALTRLTDPPRLRVAFGQPSARPPETAADVTVVVPPALYDDFAASSAAQRSPRFWPLFGDGAPDSAPAAWYCLLGPTAPEPGERELVRGPFITQDLHELGVPTPGRTAVVHTRPDGPLTLLDPIQPYGTRPPRPETYYTVDLAPHQARHTVSLPSSGKGAFTAAVELSWRVDDPVALVRGETADVSGLLLAHLCAAADRITRRHPLRRAGGAQRAVNAGVGDWPVPGLAVSYTVHLVPEGAPVPAVEQSAPSRRRLSALLAGAETVLIGFDGPLARLFSARRAREAALDLLSVVAEHRDPADALSGRPLAVTSPAGREAFVHPLDVLRAFAHDGLGPVLRARLDELELRAAPDAPTTHRSLALVRALHGARRRVSVVTDVAPRAVRSCLEPYRLPFASVHGRGEDLGLLTPHPDCLLRALDALRVPARAGVLIGSSVAELTAAQQLGLRFIGYAPTAAGRRRLREEGSEVTVASLEPLLEAARAL